METKMDLRVANGKFRLIKRCGAGAFGAIFYGKLYSFKNWKLIFMRYNTIGKNVKTEEEVAIKLVSNKRNFLKCEQN